MLIGRSALGAFSILAASLSTAAPALAETAEQAARAFGQRQSILDISLSPDGRKLAFVGAGAGSDETLNVVDLDGDMTVKRVFSVTDDSSDLGSCNWATNERLVCQIGIVDDSQGILLGFNRLIALDTDGSNPVMLTPRMSSRSLYLRQGGGHIVALDAPGQEGLVLMTKQYVKERSVGTRFANNESGLGVEAIDVETGKSKTVEGADPAAADYIADDSGRIRMVVRQPSAGNTGRLGERLLYYFRNDEGDNWHKLSEIKIDSQSREGLTPVAVDAAKNVAYAFDNRDGHDTLVEVPLDESGTAKVLLARDDVDIDHLIRIGRQRRVVGASFATEKRYVEYFDQELASLAGQLRQALPGQPMIDIVGASADENRLLIIASSDTDPGEVYLFDKTTKELNALLPLRSNLVDRQMGAMKPVSYPAADGTSIPAYLTLPPGSDGKNLPAIVLPHGGPSARDEWGFDWLVQFFVARGYAVMQPNYRGSSGYGSAWFGKNGFQAWRTAIGDIDQAGRWLVDQGIANPDKLAIVGWSYGGYAALQSQVLDPDLFQAVVAIAPVTDLAKLRQEARNYTNSRLVESFIGEGMHVTEGSPAEHAAEFHAPVMLFHGTLDQNVDVEQSRLMADRLEDADKVVHYNEYKGLDHSLSDSEARSEMLTKIDAFLASTLE